MIPAFNRLAVVTYRTEKYPNNLVAIEKQIDKKPKGVMLQPHFLFK